MKEQNISLFDYLGHAAGSTLGKQVAVEATKQKISIETKEVENRSYAGKVLTYPREFLDTYFKK